MRKLVLTLSLASLCAGPALAKNPIAEVLCEPTSALHSKLERQFGSIRSATGLRGPEQIMEVWTDPRGNWTMVVSYATGTSCIVAMGEDWVESARQDPA
ncbi:MAG: hypothetical protein AB3N23_13505 [Paracoccaceae bacterium]